MSMEEEVVKLLPARGGHFRLESGHHGDLWLDLPRLCVRPASVRRLAARLAAAIARHRIEVVCAPLVEGAFVGLHVAESLDVGFTYAEPRVVRSGGLFPVAYQVPAGLRAELAGRRVAVVNDVINAGSAVRGTLADIAACGGQAVVVAALAVLGDPAARLAAEAGVALERLVALPNEVWTPERCPLCARGVPCEEPS
jgi:orotate phosphoribosyltransferase